MFQISSANLSPGCTGRGRPLRAKCRRHHPRRLSWLTVVRLVFRIALTIGKLNRLWKISWSCKAFIITLVLWWLWINAWLPYSYATWKSWLHEMPPTLQGALSVVSVVRM